MGLSEQKINMLVTYYPSGGKYSPSGNQRRTFDALVNDGYILKLSDGYVLTDKGYQAAKAEADQRKADKASSRSVEEVMNDPVEILRRMTKELRRLRQQEIGGRDANIAYSEFCHEFTQDERLMTGIRLESDEG